MCIRDRDVSGEIPELRGEYEKHFSLSDGTYSAVVYPYAVHYDEDGTWQEIDNTLRAGTEQYTVPAEAGTEYAELMPVELGGELVSLADSEDDTAAEPAPAEDPTDAVEPSPTEEPTAEEPKPTEEPVDSGNDAEIIIIDDEDVYKRQGEFFKNSSYCFLISIDGMNYSCLLYTSS